MTGTQVKAPQSNANDDEVFIAEWKYKHNDQVKKGEHLVSIESSKVIEEVFAPETGFLNIKSLKNEKVKPGQVIATINLEKNEVNSFKKEHTNEIIFTEKAKKIIKKNNIDKSLFTSIKIVKEIDVIKVLQDKNHKLGANKALNQLMILFKNDKAYHAAVYLKDFGLVDLSLLGSRITSVKDYNFDRCLCNFYSIGVSNMEKLVGFYKTPFLLTDKIIKKERTDKGWSQSVESADFILNFRSKRSKDLNDMNCIEWLCYGLELGGLQLPDKTLTATFLDDWAKDNLPTIQKEKNIEDFKYLYK